MRIAIIGAGIAGLTLANQLAKFKLKVTIFEKARGVGGRVSTRRVDDLNFDHGAICLNAKSSEFRNFLNNAIAKGALQEWNCGAWYGEPGENLEFMKWDKPPRYVGVPNMNSLPKSMAETLNIKVNTQVINITRLNSKWILSFKDTDVTEEFDWVISTAPAPQTVALYPDNFNGFSLLNDVKMSACFSVMVGLKEHFESKKSLIRLSKSPIRRIAINHQKPMRNPALSAIVIQSSHEWADKHIDEDLGKVQETLLTISRDFIDIDVSDINYITTHLWRYSIPLKPLGKPYLIDKSLNLAACGDWCIAGSVEGAWTSAMSLAKEFIS